MNDTAFTHGSEGTHTACDTRLKTEGGKARCCYCVPHEVCEIATPQTQTDRTGGVRVPLGNKDESAAGRIMRSLDNRRFDEPEPSRLQVAMVLHALADHTAIMSALEHRPDPTSPWPQANSIGRWFHDVADDIEWAESHQEGKPE